jgi:hypothetical protein
MSETWIYFQRTGRHYVPEDRTFHNRRFDNLREPQILYGDTSVAYF